MAPRSSTAAPKLIHLHILYTVSPATQTQFVRSRSRVQVKQHAQLKGCPEKWASCPVGEVVKAMLGKSPGLIPTSREDHSLHFNSPRDTYREALYSSGADDAPPIEVQMGLVGWALDDTSEESKAMVMGVLRKDEVETEGSDEEEEEDEDAEEWLEVRLRLAKAKPISHAQHLDHLGHLQRGETPPPLPTPPPIQASPVTRSQSQHNAAASSSALTPFPAPSSSRSTRTGVSSRAKVTATTSTTTRGRPPKPAGVTKPGPVKRRKMLEEAQAAATLAAAAAPETSTPGGTVQPPSPATMVEQLLAVLQQTQSQDGSPVLTPDLLKSIKLIQGGSADSETNNIIQSILSVHSASNTSSTVGASAKSAPAAQALTSLPTPSASGPSTASPFVPRSGEMGPPPQDDAAARLRRVTTGKGKENNAPRTSSGGANGSDATMASVASSASKKRKAVENVEGCENCGTTKSSAWRRKEGSGKVCNACGIYWNRFKSKRPRELWGEPELPLEEKEILEKEKRALRPTRSSISMASKSAVSSGAAAPPSAHAANTITAASTHAHQQMLPTLPPSPYNLRTSPARLDAARARSQAFLPMTSPLRSGKTSLLPLTSPVRAIKRSAMASHESPRTALKKMLNGGSQIALSRLHKPLSDDGVRDMTLTPGSDSKMKSSSIARGLPATGSSVGLGDEDMDMGPSADDDWMHSDFSSYFSFNEDDDELMNGSNADTPRTNRTVDSSVMGGSSPFLAPFDFSTLPPSSPPTVSADLMSSPDTQRDFNSPLPPLGDDPSPAVNAMAAPAGHLDLDAVKSMLQSNSPASTSSATTIPTSTGAAQPGHGHDGPAIAGEGNAPATKEQQLEFLRLWESCQGVMGKPAALDGHTPGSETNGSGVTPPTWVTE